MVDNKIIEAEPETFWDKFKDAFGDPMIKLLLAIAGIMASYGIYGICRVWRINRYSNISITCNWYFCEN